MLLTRTHGDAPLCRYFSCQRLKRHAAYAASAVSAAAASDADMPAFEQSATPRY